MKFTLTLLLLTSSYALSSSVTPQMLIKQESQLHLIFKNSMFQKEIRLMRESREARQSRKSREVRQSRESREARDCRFELRKIPEQREIRTVRLSREIFFGYIEPKNQKLAIIQ